MSGDVQLALVWLRQRLQNDPDADEPLAVLDREVERLMGIIQGDPEIIGIHYEPGTPLEVKFRHPMAQVIVMALRDMLDGAGAPNYVEAQLHDTAKEPPETYVVTLQRKHGKTPHQLRAEAETERDRWRAWAATVAGCEPKLGCRALQAKVAERILAAEARAKRDSADDFIAQFFPDPDERAVVTGEVEPDSSTGMPPRSEDEPCGQP